MELAATGTRVWTGLRNETNTINIIAVLYLYDYLSTIALEIRTIWSRPTSTATVVFFLARYAALCNRGVSMVSLFSWHHFLEYVADYVRYLTHILISE